MLACDGFGGTEMQVANLVERLDPARVAAQVLTFAPPGPIAARLRAHAIDVRSLGGQGLPRTLIGLGTALRHGRPDVVAAYGFKASVMTRILVRRLLPQAVFICGVRGETITVVDSTDHIKGRLALTVERLMSGLVDAYDANSPGALKLLSGTGIDEGRLHYIPNGLDPSLWAVHPRPDRREPRVVCVARMVSGKRLGDLLAAAEILGHRGIDAKYVLVGDGPSRPALAEATRRRGLSARVEFCGGLDQGQVADVLAEADVFCLPSMSEGMAVSVMEAMASGLPVVGTDINGIRELVEPGVTGLLVPVGAPNGLADALEHLLADAAGRRRMGVQGRARIEREFSMERLVEAKTALYEMLAQRP